MNADLIARVKSVLAHATSSAARPVQVAANARLFFDQGLDLYVTSLTVSDLVRLVDLAAGYEALSARLNTPELYKFSEAVIFEAQHQRERWGSAHDAGKSPEDWFWLLGYLSGKALHAAKTADIEKALHHTISSAASLANWHAALLGASTAMRPGIDPAERGVEVQP